ncbi:MAG: dephospho-CoA kinase [Deltaproteobacteria bacterium]|nr:dephospho-CoA kinase [Deltaproteobacteria bacterium]MCK5710494.1 dephospho-CoA kinase [Deltaproteobacteria bacterium]
MKVIGLTGNIASGKSVVASLLEDLGAKVIDADDIARKVVEPKGPAWNEIVDVFGEDILNTDNSINRKALGEIIFNDDQKRNILNDITHPKIIQKVRETVETYQNENVEVVIIEAALIVEKGGLKDLIEGLIVVTSDEKSQLDRLKKRNGLSREEALSRINSQMPTQEKALHADYVIDNSGTIDKTQYQVKSIWNEIVT